MKIIQIAVAPGIGLLALTDTGKIFHLHDGKEGWLEATLPIGCEVEQENVLINTAQQLEPQLITKEVAADRKIDVSKLPEKLRNVFSSKNQERLCPTCGMTLKGGRCVECEITPAGGGNYDA